MNFPDHSETYVSTGRGGTNLHIHRDETYIASVHASFTMAMIHFVHGFDAGSYPNLTKLKAA